MDANEVERFREEIRKRRARVNSDRSDRLESLLIDRYDYKSNSVGAIATALVDLLVDMLHLQDAKTSEARRAKEPMPMPLNLESAIRLAVVLHQSERADRADQTVDFDQVPPE